MAYSYSLEPLHSIPDLIPACVRILKDAWPHCKAEILHELAKEELNSAPCSYGLVQHSDDPRDKDILLGHFRLIPVTNIERAVYGESLCVDKEKRGQGFGSMAVRKCEELMAKLGYKMLHVCAIQDRTEYYLRLSFLLNDKPVQTLGANLLHTYTSKGPGPSCASWPGNVLYPGWEFVYDGGAIATEVDNNMNDDVHRGFVKYLNP